MIIYRQNLLVVQGADGGRGDRGQTARTSAYHMVSSPQTSSLCRFQVYRTDRLLKDLAEKFPAQGAAELKDLQQLHGDASLAEQRDDDQASVKSTPSTTNIR